MVDLSRLKPALTKKGLLFRDGVTLLVLTLVSAGLFAMTYGLFRSFEQHREEMGRQSFLLGRIALQQGRPAQAVEDLRTALNYTPNNPDAPLLLAQGLAESGRAEEANNYFLGLWETKPGDGFLNLQLARLARRRGDAASAKNYYRAAIFGTWSGDGALRRSEVRVELADYLVSRGETSEARSELLIAKGNSPDTAQSNVFFGDRFLALGDVPDALTAYDRAAATNGHDWSSAVKAGQIMYADGKYLDARQRFQAALKALPPAASGSTRKDIEALESRSERMLDLDFSPELEASIRGRHLLEDSNIARHRVSTCIETTSMQPNGGQVAPEEQNLSELNGQWKLIGRKLSLATLARDLTLQESVARLIVATEQGAEKQCGAATGDDALLLVLAKRRSNDVK